MLLFYSSCEDSLDINEGQIWTPGDIMSMLQSQDITQRSRIDSDNFKFVSNAGVIINAEPNSFEFRDGGELVNGDIDFELLELFTKSQILQYGIPTQTTQGILESDGEFLFTASQDDKPLRLANGKALNVQVPNSDPNNGMEFFTEGENLWWQDDSPFQILPNVGIDTFSGYEFTFDRLEWVNIDYFTKFDLELTDISICAPEEYQGDKVQIWIVFQDFDIVLRSSGTNLPIGEVVSVVCIVADEDDNFRIDIQEVTIEEGLKVNLDPQLESADRIKELLKELD